jgi:hypothetical protein
MFARWNKPSNAIFDELLQMSFAALKFYEKFQSIIRNHEESKQRKRNNPQNGKFKWLSNSNNGMSCL